MIPHKKALPNFWTSVQAKNSSAKRTGIIKKRAVFNMCAGCIVVKSTAVVVDRIRPYRAVSNPGGVIAIHHVTVDRGAVYIHGPAAGRGITTFDTKTLTLSLSHRFSW